MDTERTYLNELVNEFVEEAYIENGVLVIITEHGNFEFHATYDDDTGEHVVERLESDE